MVRPANRLQGHESFNYPASGLNNVAEYMASGLPWVTQSTCVTGAVRIVDFPFVTNFVTVKNNTNGTLAIGFTSNGVQGTNKFTLAINATWTGSIRVKRIFLTSDLNSPLTFEVVAGLTQILPRSMPILTASAAGFNTASADQQYGYDGLG